MKKTLLVFTLLLTSLNVYKAQCSATTAAAFMNCSYYGDQITAFSLAGIPSTGNSGCSTSGYSLFASPVRTLTMGQTYTWTASTGLYYSNGFGMWIDWNNDGQYTTTENVAAKNYAYNHSGTITVPYSAVTGVNLRMRIRCAEYFNFSTSTSACGSLYGYGETEDYYVYIACPASVPALTVASTNTSICLGQSVTFTASGLQTYTWTSSVTSVTNAVAFSPATTGNYTVVGGVPGCPTATSTAVRTVSVSTVPISVSAISSSATICSGTNATLTASGASNFTWSPGNFTNAVIVVSPTTNITYSLVGYNGSGCPGAASVALAVNAQPTLQVSTTATQVCAGTTATLSVTGANSYTWALGAQTGTSIVITPTNASSYAVTGVNAAGCLSTVNQVVTVKNAPTLTTTASRVTMCAGATSALSASGASTYSWSNGASTSGTTVSPVSTAVYTVVGTGTNGCSSSKTVSISVYQYSLTVSQPTAICKGASVFVAAQAVGVTTYTWVGGGNSAAISVTPVTTTTYVVAATTQTNGMACSSGGSVVVTVNNIPTITASVSPAAVCRREIATISATGGSTYVWSNAKTDASFTIAPTGSSNLTYNVTGTDINGCVNTATVVLTVNACTSLQEIAGVGSGVSVLPNPNKGLFVVKLNSVSTTTTLKIFNSLGALVKEQVCTTENVNVDLEKEANGVYFIDLMQDGKKISTTKFIKE